MAGEAKSNSFLLAAATVMIGPQSGLFGLNPAANSVGLVKNFSLTATPTYTDLTQGVKNFTVASVMTANPLKATMEVFEMTSQNLAYGLGLDGSAVVPTPVTSILALKTAITGDGTTATSVVCNSATDVSAQFPPGTPVYLQQNGTDIVHLSMIVTATYASTTLTLTLADAVPMGVSYAVGTKVAKVNRIAVGSNADQPYLSAKIVGILPDGNKPITLLIPKLRITKGFTLAFQSGQFGNLPFEFTPFQQVVTDPFYNRFQPENSPALVFDEE